MKNAKPNKKSTLSASKLKNMSEKQLLRVLGGLVHPDRPNA